MANGDDGRETVTVNVGGKSFNIDAPSGLSDDEIIKRAAASDSEIGGLYAQTQHAKQRIPITTQGVYTPPQAQAAPQAQPNNAGFWSTLGGDIKSASGPLNPDVYKTQPGNMGPGQKLADPTMSAITSLHQREAAGQSLPRALTEGVAESAFGGNMQGLDQALKSGNYRQVIAHLITPASMAALQFSGMREGAETEMPSASRSTAELKTGVADAAYKRGLGVSEKFNQASDAIHAEVSNLAQTVAKKVDAAHPEGAIDLKPVMDSVNKVKEQVVKTPENFPRGIGAMLEPEPSQLEQASVFKGAGTGGRAASQKGAAGNIADIPPAARARLMQQIGEPERETNFPVQGKDENRVGFEKAKQWRSKIGAAAASINGPMKTVLRQGYTDLSQQMRSAAEDSGAIGEYTQYNQLHQKHMRFLEDPTVQKIMGGVKSSDTLKPLSDPEAMAHLDNFLQDWKKYGLNTSDLRAEGTDYAKSKAIMEKSHFRWFPGGTLGGAIGSHLLGIPWPIGAGGGLLVDRMLSGAGKASTLIDRGKVSPFYDLGAAKAARIAQGFEGVPDIPMRKVALKKP